MILDLDGIQYEVVSADLEGDRSGEINTTKQEVRITPEAKDQVRLWILGHEITHHYLTWAGLNAVLDDKMVEAVCDAVGSGWIRAVARNPGLVAAVQAEFSKS